MSETKRVKLTVKGLEQIQSFGTDGQKLPFSAIGEDGKELMYVTYNKKFFSLIKPEAVIDVDVQVVERNTKSGTFIDRKITQLYEEGKAVASQKPFGYRKSPEELKQEWELKQQERESIEAQTALKFIGQVAAFDTVEIPADILKAAWDWVGIRLAQSKAEGLSATSSEKTPQIAPQSTPGASLQTAELTELINKVRAEIKFIGCTEKYWLSGHNYPILPWSKRTPQELQEMLHKIKAEYADFAKDTIEKEV